MQGAHVIVSMPVTGEPPILHDTSPKHTRFVMRTASANHAEYPCYSCNLEIRAGDYITGSQHRTSHADCVAAHARTAAKPTLTATTLS